MKKVALQLSLVLLVSFGFIACEEDPQKKEIAELQEEFDAKMKETIAIHDEAMPKMGEISNTLQKLEVVQEELDQEEYLRTTEYIEKAHNQMMQWMKDFSNTFDKEEINSGIKSQDIDELKQKHEQLDQIKKDAETMNQSIKESLRYGSELLRSIE